MLVGSGASLDLEIVRESANPGEARFPARGPELIAAGRRNIVLNHGNDSKSDDPIPMPPVSASSGADLRLLHGDRAGLDPMARSGAVDGHFSI